MDFSKLRQQSRRNTRDLLSFYLQRASREGDKELIKHCQYRLLKMNEEDAMGFIIRSRHKEMTEKETCSLFHVNREIKKGNKSSVNRLSKIVENQRVVITNTKEIESMAISCFTDLFQGHHRSICLFCIL